MKKQFIQFIFFFSFFNMLSQSNSDFVEVGIGRSIDLESNETSTGLAFSTSYAHFLNRYLVLEGKSMYQNINNFPVALETGNFSNSKYFYGEYISKQAFSIGANIHLVFINQQKNVLSFFTGVDLSFINKNYFFGVNENGLPVKFPEEKVFFVINNAKYKTPALNYGISYRFQVYGKLALGLKLNGFSPLGKKMQDESLTIYSAYITISKTL